MEAVSRRNSDAPFFTQRKGLVICWRVNVRTEQLKRILVYHGRFDEPGSDEEGPPSVAKPLPPVPSEAPRLRFELPYIGACCAVASGLLEQEGG